MNEIQKAAEGLFYISESDHPLEYFTLPPGVNIESELKKMSQHQNGPVQTQTLAYFFRNMTKEREGEDTGLAKKFQHLQKVLNKQLQDIEVYRIGEVQVDAFVIGQLESGGYAGLRTKLIET